MKKHQQPAELYFKNGVNSTSFFNSAKDFFEFKESYISQAFMFLKANNEKLAIIYANIRV